MACRAHLCTQTKMVVLDILNIVISFLMISEGKNWVL